MSASAAACVLSLSVPKFPAIWRTAGHVSNLTVILMVMYTRVLELPSRSFFLFGPRGTGKTTWLRTKLADAKWFDLVRDREVFRLQRDPDLFRHEVEALKPGSWVVLDEIQRAPGLLGDVQDLVARRGNAYRFALTGSSARKLRRGDVNLLPGRLVNRHFFPLTFPELGDDFDLEAALAYGTLPSVIGEEDAEGRIEMLTAYVENYLAQEIRAEALVKRLDSFSRFLDVAALANGQVTNTSSLARDAAVARPTVQGYFEILVDTLIASPLPAWRPRAKVKEIQHPKFYFFDPGVVRALSGRLHDPVADSERGHLLETYVLHELRAFLSYHSSEGKLCYWRTPSGSEIDFVWERGTRSVGIELKASSHWRREFALPLRERLADGSLKKGFGVYLGPSPLKADSLHVLPLQEFLQRLWRGEILG